MVVLMMATPVQHTRPPRGSGAMQKDGPVANASNDISFRFLQDIASDLAAGDISFPTFSAATVEVRAALDDPDASAEKLARIVAREPLLSAKLVRLANSAALNSTGKPIGDVKTAVIRVGHAAVRAVAVAVAYDQLRADKALRPQSTRAEAAWRHSLQVAALSYVIAGKLTRISADEALFAGLVHDIGYFYLLARASRYPELEGHPEDLDAMLREWHPGIGQAVLHSFGLSDAVMESVGEHETAAPRIPPRTMADVVRLANLVTPDTNPVRDVTGEADQSTLDYPELFQVIAQSREQINSLVSALH